MGADSIIVNAAFKEAISKAGAAVPDMSNVIKGQVEVNKTYLGGIANVFADMKKNREEIEAAQSIQLQAFKDQARKAASHILEHELSQPMKVHDAIYDKFKALEKKFELYNTTGDDDNESNEKMRAHLYAQLGMITNQAVKSRGTIAKKATMADDVVNSPTAQELAVGRAIMGVDGDYEHVELFFNKDSQLTYLVQLPGMDKAVKWTIDDFNEKIVIHNKENDVFEQTVANTFFKAGQEGETLTPERLAVVKDNYINEVIKNKRDFTDAAFSKSLGRKSWVNSLYDLNEDTINIATKAIEHLFTEDMMDKIALVDVDDLDGITILDVDTDESGTITKDDMKNLSPKAQAHWQANIESIIGALTKTDHDAFNLQRSSEMVGQYYMDGLNKEYERGFNNQPGTELTYAQRLAREKNLAAAKEIDDLVRQENPSILDLKGAIAKEYDIEREGNEYVIYKKYKDTKAPEIRFNVKDKNALSDALYEYSGSDEYYRKGKYDKYEYQKGDTIENPILRDFKTAQKEGGEEGKYYKNEKTGKVYQFINGEYKELGLKKKLEINEDEI